MLRLSIVGTLSLLVGMALITGSTLLVGTLLPRKQLTYVSSSHEFSAIYLLDLDRQTLFRLIINAYTPAWSRDGSRLAFYSTSDGRHDIYIMDVPSLKIHRLTDNNANNSNPTWSPDGSQIAFASDYGEAFGIFVMPVDCTDSFEVCATRLTPKDNDWYAAPTWSPDGSRIAFVSTRDTTSSLDDTVGNSNVYVMNHDGSNTRRLTFNLGEDYDPDWSPDSRSLVYAAQNIQNGTMELMVMDADCPTVGGCQRVLFSDVVDLMPSWSADGREIVFVDAQQGNFEIFVTDAEGQNIRRLTVNNRDETSPRWRP